MKKEKSSKRGTTLTIEELRKKFGLKQIVYQTKDKKRLESQRERFQGSHLCPACKQPMTFVEGANVMSCKNPECKGIKNVTVDEETGEEKVFYTPAYHLLDEKGAKIAQNIFKK